MNLAVIREKVLHPQVLLRSRLSGIQPWQRSTMYCENSARAL